MLLWEYRNVNIKQKMAIRRITHHQQCARVFGWLNLDRYCGKFMNLMIAEQICQFFCLAYFMLWYVTHFRCEFCSFFTMWHNFGWLLKAFIIRLCNGVYWSDSCSMNSWIYEFTWKMAEYLIFIMCANAPNMIRRVYIQMIDYEKHKQTNDFWNCVDNFNAAALIVWSLLNR